MSPRVIYTLWTTYPNPSLIVQKEQCTRFPQKQANGYMFQTKRSSIKQGYMKLGDEKKNNKG